MNILTGLRATVSLMILTTALGVYVDIKDHELHARNLMMRSGLEETLRAKEALSSMLLIAVLERNILRARRYEKVNGELDRAISSVGELNHDLKFSADISALMQRHRQLQAREADILDLMREGQWPQARAALLDADFVRGAAMHQIDVETTVDAMTNELNVQTELFDMLRVVSMALRVGSLILLLWVGFAYSRQLVAEVALQRRLKDELAASQQALRGLAAHEQAKRADERKSMAQEIHDELGQRLTVLRMDLAMLPREVQADPGTLLPLRVQALKTNIDAIMAIVRDVAARLRPAALEVGLAAAVESLMQEFQQALGIPCELDNQLPASLRLDEVRLTALFRILQESLTNVARHARASRVLVGLAVEEQHLHLRVQDDGRGLLVAPGGTYGLTGMRERAAALGGTLTISGDSGAGTTVDALIPLGKPLPPDVLSGRQRPSAA